MAKKKESAQKAPKKDEMIGFHKGAVSTLLKERQELIKMIQITETLLRAHLNELQKLGVKVTAEKKE